jgi:hypothetical protein
MLTVFGHQSLNGIDSILFATGYRHSFPFLPQFHNSSRTDKDNDLSPIITDGTHLRNLYLDILSIDEPTLGFMGSKSIRNLLRHI